MKPSIKSIMLTPSVSLLIVMAFAVINYIISLFVYTGTDKVGRTLFFLMFVGFSIIPLLGSIKELRINLRVLSDKPVKWKSYEGLPIMLASLSILLMNHNIVIDCVISVVMTLLTLCNIRRLYSTAVNFNISPENAKQILNSVHYFWKLNEINGKLDVCPVNNEKFSVKKNNVTVDGKKYDSEGIKNLESIIEKPIYDMTLDDVKVVEMVNY